MSNNPVFTDYAPKGSASAHARLASLKQPSKSKSEKDLLTRMEDAAFTWCHNQLMPAQTTTRTTPSKMKTKRLPERPSPVIITSNACLTQSSTGRVDDPTPPSIISSSSSASLDDQDTYAYSSVTNSIEDGSFEGHIGVGAVSSSVPTLKRRTLHNDKAVPPHEQLANHCGRFCLTTEGMLQKMIFDDLEAMQRQERHQQRANDGRQEKEGVHPSRTIKHVSTIEDSTTSEESYLSSSSSSSEGSVVDAVQEPNLDPHQQQRRGLNARFSSLWKNRIKDRRHRALAASREVEVDHPSPPLHNRATRQQHTDVEVKLTEESSTWKQSNEMDVARGTNFRPIMTLRNLRQQKVEQEQLFQMQLDRSWRHLRTGKREAKEQEDTFVMENKISVVQQNPDGYQINHSKGKDVAKTAFTSRNTIDTPKRTYTRPFDESDTDRDYGRRSSRLKRLMDYNRLTQEERKPFDEESTSVDVVDCRHNFKIVGKWKEEGEHDSDFYSVADTPFTKKTDIYKPREAVESDTENSQLSEHLSFMKDRTSPPVPIHASKTVRDISVSEAPGETLKPREHIRHQQQPPLTNLERKLGKKEKFCGVLHGSVSTTTPCVKSSAVSCTSSFNASSTNAVFFPRFFDDCKEAANETFLNGEDSEGDEESLGSIFATDISTQS
jgi:hypothetical protein